MPTYFCRRTYTPRLGTVNTAPLVLEHPDGPGDYVLPDAVGLLERPVGRKRAMGSLTRGYPAADDPGQLEIGRGRTSIPSKIGQSALLAHGLGAVVRKPLASAYHPGHGGTGSRSRSRMSATPRSSSAAGGSAKAAALTSTIQGWGEAGY